MTCGATIGEAENQTRLPMQPQDGRYTYRKRMPGAIKKISRDDSNGLDEQRWENGSLCI